MSRKKSFPLRINEETWEAVRRWSDEELRSVNAQIEYVIREALRKAGRLPKATGDSGKAIKPGGEKH